ncbi:MAG: transketolase [Acidimicrobiia bacterium]|nr:transketolase [Acidimicrobiia bacterium]MYC46499.1 transketolase [Acidimicrobiia bacterium]MYI20105.1 transketolase [Acidimicrobiia bacterium]
MPRDPTLDQRAIEVIRGLAMDAPHAARSGHQGTAMALAPLAHVLWSRVMTFDPAAPDWPDRDRFVLSAGHASILLYSMAYLCGYDLTLEDLKAFRQWGSRTPGHPEAETAIGVEVTTGPLGQGFANAVGMALTERWLRTRYGPELCDHHTFVICSDGDLAEGVSHEAASMAGHLGLGRLVYVYDDNRVSIDGGTDLWLSDDAAGRFAAYGWHVETLGEVAEDLDALEAALRRAMVAEAPSLLVLRSHIAHPSPDLTDAPAAHGYALGDEEIAAAKAVMGVPPTERFRVPDDVLEYYRAVVGRGAAARRAWEARWAAAGENRSELPGLWAARPPAGWDHAVGPWEVGASVATRAASGSCLNALAGAMDHLLAGGADLTGNTGTKLTGDSPLSRETGDGRQVFYGVREHAMGAAMVGVARHGGLLPVGGTFLVFSDYMRPAVRLAALSRARVVFCWSHDSLGVGEDGPTHQPVEHVAALRAIPDLTVLRPADAPETLGAWRVALEAEGPTALILTRQATPVLAGTSPEGVALGAYVLDEPAGAVLTLVGSGSEVALCVGAAERLAAEGIAAAVVSMPCWELFAAQPAAYRQAVIPPDRPSVAVEAGVTQGWERWVDRALGVERFGASAPGNIVLAELGMNPDRVVAAARELLDTRPVPQGADGRRELS